MRNFFRSFSLLLLAVVMLAVPAAMAQEMEGSVLFVAPHRLTITPNETSETISVSNKSSATRRYDVMLIDQVMNSEGVTKRVEKKEEAPFSARDLLDYKPRRFTLSPGQSQIVRVAVKRPNTLADGDYHSHLLFREVPLSEKDKLANPEAAQPAGKTVTFEIRTLYGIGVPVIVQKGKIEADMDMGAPSLGAAEGKTRPMTITFKRIGNAEAAGKLTAEYVAGGKSVSVLDPQWVRIYREADKVTKSFPLALPSGASGGKVVVSLIRDEADPKKTVTKEISLK